MTLKQLLSYSQQGHAQWSPRRLARCLHYIYKHGINPNPEEKLSIASFKSCVRWILKILEFREQNLDAETSLQIQTALKFICSFLESNSVNNTTSFIALITVIRHHRGVESLLYWLQQSNNPPIQLYSVRALIAHVQHFARDIARLGGYTILPKLLSNIPSLLTTLSFIPPVTDAAQRQKELDQCVMICRLLDSIIKINYSLSNPGYLKFAESPESFATVADIWMSVCADYYRWIRDKDNKPIVVKAKNRKFLVYSLTSIIQNCVQQSETAGSYINKPQSRSHWQSFLSMMMGVYIRETCCYNMDSPPTLKTLSTMEQDKSIIVKLINISLHVLPRENDDPYFLDLVLLNITNFLTAFVSQPILPEDAAVVTLSRLIHKNLRVDVEERGYHVTEMMLTAHQTLLTLLLESLIRHVQLVDPSIPQRIAGHVAWSLKSLLTILLALNPVMDETSGLYSRIRKLIVFFLHYDESIHILATSTTNISAYVWGPTIEIAKLGLLTASTHVEMAPEQVAMLSKAKRAFVALQLISKHPRACERLVDCDVLQLVSPQFIPDNFASPLVLSVYALFGQFVAALSRRTAFVRTRLRDECGLFPMIMKLLQEAVKWLESKSWNTSKTVIVGWNRLISSCLLVISAFQYDESSMRMWLSYQKGTEQRTSVLPLVLAILFPWRQRPRETPQPYHVYYNSELDVLLLTAQVLDQLSTIPSCGRQMIMDQQAMSDLGTLVLFCSDHRVDGKPNDEINSASLTEEKDEETIGQQEKNREEVSDKKKEIKVELRECLHRSVVRIFSSHENIQYIILSDTFTHFFRPLVDHHPPGRMNSNGDIVKDELQLKARSIRIRNICDELYQKKLQDYLNLFHFTEYGEHATRLHEFTAVALTYLAQGTIHWNQLLGLHPLETDIVSKKGIFSILCQMLVYGLEYEADDSLLLEQDNLQDPTKDILLSTITPMRRNAAAQAIEILALSYETRWMEETTSLDEKGKLLMDNDDIHSRAMDIDIFIDDKVRFSTEDAAEGDFIAGNPKLLQAKSPVFNALLSGDYAETKQNVILLHDVTFHHLNYFINILHQMNDLFFNKQEEWEDILQTLIPLHDTPWNDVIGLLQTADRFGSVDVRHLCECWVLKNVANMSICNSDYRLEGLEGAIRLFRLCRDPIEKDGGVTSNTWPFAMIVRECLKCIAQHMSESSKTTEFLNMVEECNEEELNAFCDGLAVLLHNE